LPLNHNHPGALPARFRRSRVLIVGCGDVGTRAARLLAGRVQVLALTSSPERLAELRAAGCTPLRGNLDQPATLRRLAGLAARILHLAPPPAQGAQDPRTRHLLHALAARGRPRALVYGSTSGVYGDCAGARVDETRPLAPQTARAKRRVDAERSVRAWGRRHGIGAAVLRIPGIYAPDRAGGTPRDRLLKQLPVLQAHEDVYTNHIHADDLARACVLALWRAQPQRVYNIADGCDLKMGDYFEQAADLYQMPRPPRLPRPALEGLLSPMQLSFMAESRRLSNQRMLCELGLRLRYPTVWQGLQAGSSA
jgi:nucleoside-diphosphate-sugar epimerase